MGEEPENNTLPAKEVLSSGAGALLKKRLSRACLSLLPYVKRMRDTYISTRAKKDIAPAQHSRSQPLGGMPSDTTISMLLTQGGVKEQ